MIKKILILLLFLSTFSILSCGKSKENIVSQISPVEHLVVFNSNTGISLQTLTILNGTLLPEPTNPVKNGYTFMGWYCDSNYTTQWNFSSDKVTSDIILYAKWKENVQEYTVTFDVDEGIKVTISVESNHTIDEPTAPTKSGYIFQGWYKENQFINLWDFNYDKILGNTTLYAKWIQIPNLIFVEKGTAGNSKIAVLESFYIQKYEVTQGEFEKLMKYNPSTFNSNGGEILDNNPVEHVTWYDAIMYANLLSKKEGWSEYYSISDITRVGNRIVSAVVTENFLSNGYRLPSEQQWEYAARGGSKSMDYIYSGSNDYDEVAWVYENDITLGESTGTKRVGKKKPNELGIYDMTGNVFEWTNSIYLSDENRGIRGGSWANSGEIIPVTYRGGGVKSSYNERIGFRLVRPY